MTDSCVCENPQALSEYYIYYMSEDAAEQYVNNDFIKTYHCYPSSRLPDALLKNSDLIAIVRCFTIADAFRLVKYLRGNLSKRPEHKTVFVEYIKPDHYLHDDSATELKLNMDSAVGQFSKGSTICECRTRMEQVVISRDVTASIVEKLKRMKEQQA